MILCIQNLFGTGNIFLFDADETLRGSREWKISEERINLVEVIHNLLQRAKISPSEIQKMYIVSGPGPFSSVRILTVFARVWKNEFPHVQLCPVSSGKFLSLQFLEAEYLFLSAGRTAFFSFEKAHPDKFQKLSFAEITNFSGLYGGFFHRACILPENLQLSDQISGKEVFQRIISDDSLEETQDYFPEYGSEANIQQ